MSYLIQKKIIYQIFDQKTGGKSSDFLRLFLRKKVVNFERELREIDSNYPLMSPRHVLEDSLSFPTVCGMLMDIFFTKNPVIGKLWALSSFELSVHFFTVKLI